MAARRPGRSQTPRRTAAKGRDAGVLPQRDLITHLARFSGELRQVGIPVGLSDEIDAAAALRCIDIGDSEEVRLALRSALKVRRRWWADFDRLFTELWREAARPRSFGDRPHRAPPRWRGDRNSEPPLLRLRRRLQEQNAGGATADTGGDRPGYSPRALLREKTFEAASEEELAEMIRLLEQLARRLATRRTRRLVPAAHGPVVDIRRSLRRSLAHEGELFELARRARAVEAPSLVALCDTSGSMDIHARFLLAFVLALGRAGHRVETFAFNTSLTRLTSWITSGSAATVLERLAGNVQDWSGGTRIGACLLDFADLHLRRWVASDTTVLILSDGLDRGEGGALEAALAAIRRRARRVVWLNPLMGDAHYRPEARGMKAALPYLDRLAPAHNLAALEAALPMLVA